MIYFAWLLSFSMGFLSLSQEILWIRLFGFTNHSMPQAFAFVLIVFLLGIAFGAASGKKACTKEWALWKISGTILLVASFFDLMSPWIYSAFAQTSSQVFCGGLLIFITAFLKSMLFPIAHYMGADSAGSKVGRAVSRVYVANIAGATLGPIFTSVLLLNILTTQQCFAFYATLAFLLGLSCLRVNAPFNQRKLMGASVTAIIMLGVVLTIEPSGLIKDVAVRAGEPTQVVENSQGIIVIYKNPAIINNKEQGDIVYGGNVYDGRTNLDPAINSNGINRILVLSALHDKPEHVLMIGLSIGSWLKLMTGFPHVKSIDVIEINPGYLKAMQAYPKILSALSDPRVHLHIDDGRRWLRTHPDNRYDLVVMNTTYFWRAYTTNLLSKEFLSLVKLHMNPRAIFTYNTTGSPNAFKTATTLFKYAYLYENFVIAADFDWRKKMHSEGAASKLAAIRLDNKPLFKPGSSKIINGFLTEPLGSIQTVESLMPPRYKYYNNQLETVTDRNLITEYRYSEHRL